MSTLFEQYRGRRRWRAAWQRWWWWKFAETRRVGIMARVSYVEIDRASEEVREIYEQKLKGKPGNIQKALAHRPELLKNFLPFYASVGRSLERRLFELLY